MREFTECGTLPPTSEEGRKKLIAIQNNLPTTEEAASMIHLIMSAVKDGNAVALSHRQATILSFLLEDSGVVETRIVEKNDDST